MTPLGSFSYFTRLNSILHFQEEIQESVSCTCTGESPALKDCKCWNNIAANKRAEIKCTKRLCAVCVQYVNELEELQLNMFKIENTIFELYTQSRLEPSLQDVLQCVEGGLQNDVGDLRPGQTKINKYKVCLLSNVLFSSFFNIAALVSCYSIFMML